MLKTYEYQLHQTVSSLLRAGRFALGASILISSISGVSYARKHTLSVSTQSAGVPANIMAQILRAEDQRSWGKDLRSLFSHRNASVRKRAALAAGRIGSEAAVADLVELMRRDRDNDVRATAAFALGEIESVLSASALLESLKGGNSQRARAIEALGKIAASLPKEQEAKQKELARAVLDALSFEHRRGGPPVRLTVLLAITAVLRARPDNAGPVLAEFLTYSDARIRSDAANALARLRLKDANGQLLILLRSDVDANVKANAARVLGATEDKNAFEALLDRSLRDSDVRVRVSSIRALAGIKDGRATVSLVERGKELITLATRARQAGDGQASPANPAEISELLEIATTLGVLRQHTDDERTLTFLKQLRTVAGSGAPEVEIAIARIHPGAYVADFGSGPKAKMRVQEDLLLDWRAASSIAQGLGQIALIPDSPNNNKTLRALAADLLRAMLDYRNSDVIVKTLAPIRSEYAIPAVLRAFAAFKPDDLGKVLGSHLKESDVIVRSTAADLLGEMPADEASTRALVAALPVALRDKELNDAALSTLGALAKQKNAKANGAIRTALDSADYLVRRRAVTLLKANGVGDFSARIGTVQTHNTGADYQRAVARIGTRVSATIATSKGSFTIELLPNEAPLTVDNFIQLAQRGYFRGISVHRVVPNFVIQDGDPRGDGNGGPGYQIRCEINEVPYDRGALGMALSGKDTGGSQWFVTHAPQPHLDGGYTVFGKVASGMNAVDSIIRGDIIVSIVIEESGRRVPYRRR